MKKRGFFQNDLYVLQSQKECFTIYLILAEKKYFVVLSKPVLLSCSSNFTDLIYTKLPYCLYNLFFENPYEAIILANNYNLFSTGQKRSNGIF